MNGEIKRHININNLRLLQLSLFVNVSFNLAQMLVGEYSGDCQIDISKYSSRNIDDFLIVFEKITGGSSAMDANLIVNNIVHSVFLTTASTTINKKITNNTLSITGASVRSYTSGTNGMGSTTYAKIQYKIYYLG